MTTKEINALVAEATGTSRDFVNDLNACHEMEKAIKGLPDQLQYLHILSPVHSEWTLATATAAERCEAFLRTIGKWKDAGKEAVDEEPATT